MGSGKRIMLLAVAGLLSASALLAIGILLVGHFGKTEGRILATTALLGGLRAAGVAVHDPARPEAPASGVGLKKKTNRSPLRFEVAAQSPLEQVDRLDHLLGGDVGSDGGAADVERRLRDRRVPT